MKRTISFLLALVMLLGILPMAAFAEDTETTLPKVTLTANKTEVLAGEDITLTLSLDGDVATRLNNWQWNIIWDSTCFAYKASTIGDSPTPFVENDDAFKITPIVNPNPLTSYASPYKAASVTAGDKLTMHWLKKGTIATVTLTAKADITAGKTAKFFVQDMGAVDTNNEKAVATQLDPNQNWGTDTKQSPAEGVGLSVAVTPKSAAPDPISISVYYADNGEIVTGKDSTLLNYAPVTVTDVNGDGMLTISDGFACFHDTYHTAGSTGYADNDSGWVTKFWSVDSPSVSYGHNNGWVFSTAEEIANGDSLCLFTYQDTDSYSDLFAYFDSLTATATAQEAKNFHVDGISFMQSSNTTSVTAAPAGATVTATCDGQEDLSTTVDEEGNFSLTFPAAGEWTVLVNGACNYTAVGGFMEGPFNDAPVVPAQMTVTVAAGEEETDPNPTPDPDLEKPTPTGSGYTITLDEKKEVAMGETVSINVKVGHTDEAVLTYNAFDMTFSYNAEVLELTSDKIDGLTVTTPTTGTVRVQGYGEDRDIDSVAFTLTFQAKETGKTDVNVTSPKVDAANHAIDADAPEAVKTVGTTNVTIGGYRVNLPDNFTGATVVEPNTDYTFRAKDKNYDYTFEDTTMGGEKAEVVDNKDGTFTIKNVTGTIDVKAEKSGKKFGVTLGTNMTGAQEAQYMTDYEATVTEEANYSYSYSVTIGDEEYTDFTREGDKITIPGKDITGAIVFEVTKTSTGGGTTTTYKVTFTGSGLGDATGAATVASGATYTFTLNKETGYNYVVTATMGTQTASVNEDEEAGTYTIANVTGDLTIDIAKNLDVTVMVNEFVQLDGKTMFLVTANATLSTGKALTYDGATMFYSDGTEGENTGYNAWCYLVIVDKETSFTVADATAKIDAATKEFTPLAGTKDVNESTVVDINDAQLVYDIYNGKYPDFETVSMQKFLNADVNHDRVVNVSDAAAVVAAIQ